MVSADVINAIHREHIEVPGGQLDAGGRLLSVRLLGEEITTREVEEVWEHAGALVFKFRGVDSISDAETLRGSEVQIPASERVEVVATDPTLELGKICLDLVGLLGGERQELARERDER